MHSIASNWHLARQDNYPCIATAESVVYIALVLYSTVVDRLIDALNWLYISVCGLEVRCVIIIFWGPSCCVWLEHSSNYRADLVCNLL